MNGKDEKIIFNVEGMSCGHCKASIESAVRALEGVTDARVSLEDNQVEIAFNPGVVKREELETAITGAGYQVVG